MASCTWASSSLPEFPRLGCCPSPVRNGRSFHITNLTEIIVNNFLNNSREIISSSPKLETPTAQFCSNVYALPMHVSCACVIEGLPCGQRGRWGSCLAKFFLRRCNNKCTSSSKKKRLLQNKLVNSFAILELNCIRTWKIGVPFSWVQEHITRDLCIDHDKEIGIHHRSY